MENTLRTQEEIDNDNQIPAELKAQLTKKVEVVINHIGLLENAINEVIDDIVEDSETPITSTEINAALFNVLRKLNQREIMQLVK
jgi:hypothetical protein